MISNFIENYERARESGLDAGEGRDESRAEERIEEANVGGAKVEETATEMPAGDVAVSEADTPRLARHAAALTHRAAPAHDQGSEQ